MRRGPAKSQVALQHRKLPDRAAAMRMKQYWSERLEALKDVLAAAAGNSQKPGV